MDKFYSENMVDIYCGHVLDIFKQLPDESVQMTMTSPPYWGLRNYAGGEDIVWGGDESCEHEWTEETQGLQHENRINLRGTQEEVVGKTGTAFIQKYDRLPAGICVKCGAWRGQLGLEPTPKLYVEHLMMIFREVKRVLRDDGSFYLNIGDTYFSNPSNQQGHGFGKSGAGTRAAFENLGRQKRISTNSILKPKCMVCIPERVMFAMIDDGWILRNKIIWHKPNSMPGSQKDRFTTSWEYLYFFNKNNETILWRNHETGEWRDTRPTKDEKYPWGGMYQHIETSKFSWIKPPENEKDNWIKLQPLWMGFDYYFDLDAVREPHKTLSLERHQRGVNLDRPAIGKSAEVGPMQQYKRAPQWFQDEFPPDTDYKGKFDDLFGHGPQPQSFNLRVRDVKRGKGGVSAQGGALKASEKEIEEYEYPERTPRKYDDTGFGTDGKGIREHKGRSLDQPKGKNPGDYWELTTQPYKGAHFAVFPEKLCERPIKASSRPGDVVLDFFSGSGTAGVVAKRLGRKVILIDCVESYCELAKNRIIRVEYQPELIQSSIECCGEIKSLIGI